MLTLAQKKATISDPAKYSRAWLNRRLWQKQKEIARAVDQFPLVSVKGCHASGKTHVASGLPLWWITKHKKSVALNTAPTLRQVKVFWGEIGVAHRESNLRTILPEPATTSLRIDKDRYAEGVSSSLGVNLQGYHSKNMLIIIDEAPGVSGEIFNAIEGIRAGGNVHLLALGNPVVPTGDFYDSFHRGRNIWKPFSISAFDTPNLQNELTGEPLTIEELVEMPNDDPRLDIVPFPGLISRRWVRERYIVWGPTHPQYLSRVLAEFPTQADNAVFNLAWIEKGKRDPTAEELKHARRYPIQVGIDVAGAGSDETVLVARVGGIILEMHVWPDADPRGKVLGTLRRLQAHPLYRLGAIVIDTVGIGYNFALHVADNGFRQHVFGFNAGARAIDAQQFANQKTEAAFQLREWFRLGHISGLGWQHDQDANPRVEMECEAQLSTMLYRETGRGITELIPKEEMKKKFNVQSPDRAEALVMSFVRVVPKETNSDVDMSLFRISDV